jgi:DNA-binding MarR family transcriptional regulator
MKHSALASIVGGLAEETEQAPRGGGDRSATAELLLREVSQLQAQAGRLVAAVEAADGQGFAQAPGPACTEKVVRDILQARLERNSHFPAHLFSDPAWDMLLDLYAAELAQIRVSVTSLCIASNAPTSTALRWINTLENDGLIRRDHDPLDARRFFLSLTGTASQAFRNYFSGTAGRLAAL